MKIKSLCFLIFLLSLFLLSGCESMFKTANGIDKSELPKWTISVNELVQYPTASPGEKEIPAYSGEGVWIRKHFEFNSKTVKKVTAIPSQESGKMNLKIEFNRQGSMVAMRMCNEPIHPTWGLVVDGVYYNKVNIRKDTEKEDDYSEVILSCNIDPATAKQIEKYSEANYEKLHPNGD